MADQWTTPLTWVAGNLSVANLNQYIRDNQDALKAGLVGDASADADIKQAIKSGTLAARPAASLAGRQYYETVLKQSFIDDGTAWQHLSGSGAFDSFERTAGDAMGTADSGHGWTEHAGDIDTVGANRVEATAANSIATIDTGAPLRTAHYGALFQVGNVAGNFDVGIILRYVDASNYLYVQLSGAGAINIVKRVATVETAVDTTPLTFTALNFYFLEVFVRGPSVVATVGLDPATSFAKLEHSLLTDTYTAGGFSGATRTGLRFTTGGAGVSSCHDFFAVPNA